MISGNEKCYGLSSNTLKIIAAFSMLIDHIGVILLPDALVLRIIGRIAFPIYAFMIAEGCEYTKNKLRYFLSIFVLGIACQIVYYIYGGGTDMGILITFSLSILVTYAMQYLKKVILDGERDRGKQCIAILVFLSAIAGTYLLNRNFDIDYGFLGCMIPVFASVFRKSHSNASLHFEKLDTLTVHVFMLGIGLIILSYASGGIQSYSLYAIPLLLLYSGKRGKRKMKSFFYIFYPAHLVVLECVFAILER